MQVYPVFIPHIGCPHLCVFCDQKAIACDRRFDPADAEREIDAMLVGKQRDGKGEIAFFGGSFTGIDEGLFHRLLRFAAQKVECGLVGGIRFSTRPDYLSDAVLALLRRYPIKTVELGLQSLSDAVLTACERGHDAACAMDACRRVKAQGYDLIGQMMIGLPEATGEDEKETARSIASLCDGARIYPTVVFPGTKLQEMEAAGRYRRLSQAEAIARTADAFAVFLEAQTPVIRIGLCSTETVRTLGEGFDGAIGERVMGEIYRRRIDEQLARIRPTGCATVLVARGHASLAAGHKKENRIDFARSYGIRLRILERDGTMPFCPLVTAEESANQA